MGRKNVATTMDVREREREREREGDDGYVIDA